ncbi:MAG: hypothetical protein M1833_004144 [Piccolia ochrophora]|nr:MAG: hypothetical protein M1833_004144 [Piccolia ochrophora]
MAATVSIEETNKIRAALGMAPLPVPGGGPVFKDSTNGKDASDSEEEKASTLETRQAAGYDNWKKLQDEADAKAKRDAKNEAIKKARDAARRFAKLDGKGLGDADAGEEMDTKTWILQQKKRQKKLDKARKLEKELAERELPAEYTSADLAGVKVGHELEDFEGGDEQVLTLKDTTIDENEEEGDELENLDLREREKLEERTELKKKKPVYNPNDVEEGGEKSLLGQYDEEIDGKKKEKKKKFTLAGTGASMEEKEAMKEDVREKLRAQPINLDALPTEAPSDYIEATELKTRKPKKKKAKSTRRKEIDEDDIFPPVETVPTTVQNDDAMQVDSAITNGDSANQKKRRFEETSFADDDDLQASLALQRRNALKKRKKLRPEDIAKQLREEQSATPGVSEVDGNAIGQEEEGGLVIDETSEFVANLQKPTAPKPRRRSTSKPTNGYTPHTDSPTGDLSPNGDVDMDRSYADLSDEEEASHAKRETSTPAVDDALTSTGLNDETTLTTGIGATLSMLSQRGLIDRGASSSDLNALHRERQRFLSAKQAREAAAEKKARTQRERDRASGKLSHMSAREKEAYAQAENKSRDTLESRQMADVFNREYKPDVEITYTDEFGRQMNAKEAFKHLSHQFHGKGSGKMKMEKRLKKIENEKKAQSESVLDAGERAGRGIGGAVGVVGRRERRAGVRLG